MPHLSTDQHSHFQRDGYLIVRELFGREEIDHIRKVFTTAMDNGPIEGLNKIDRIPDKNDPLARWPRMLHPHLHDDKPVGPLAMKYMLDERLHNVLRELFGEEPIAAQSMFYFKPPGARGQDLHQDNFYLRIAPGTCMAAWIAVDDADRENGGMVVAPGSHKLDVVCPEASDQNQFFTDHHVEPPKGMEPVAADMKAGDVLFFNGSVIHGSYPNTSSDRFRRALICHYAPASCEEAAEYYTLFDFKGNRLTRRIAEGGGPCGEIGVAVKGAH